MLFKSVTLVDASSVIYRAFTSPQADKMSGFSHNPLAGPSFLLLNSIRSILKNYEFPIFVFDGYPEEKYKLYPDYKKNRNAVLVKGKSRAEIWEYIRGLFLMIPSTITRVDNAEADSVIASLVKLFYNSEWVVKIITGDHDLLGLLDMARIFLSKQGKLSEFSRKNFMDKYHISPSQFQLYKAIFGDTSDSYPRIISRIKSKLLYSCVLSTNTTPEQVVKTINENKDLLGKWYDVLVNDGLSQLFINWELAGLDTGIKPIVKINPGIRSIFETLLGHMGIKPGLAEDLFNLGTAQNLLLKQGLIEIKGISVDG